MFSFPPSCAIVSSLNCIYFIKFDILQDQPGDSFYVRAIFDRIPDSNQPYLLSFKKDDILYVENTMYSGVPGMLVSVAKLL